MILTYVSLVCAAACLGSLFVMKRWWIPRMEELRDECKSLSDAAVASYDKNSAVVKLNNRRQNKRHRILTKSVDDANAEWHRMRQMVEDRNDDGEEWKR